jgi:hypothetical protein
MMKITFRKLLSANDVGLTGGHQGGVLIPKGDTELLKILPYLDPKVKNPDTWITCVDERKKILKFRFVYYNNKYHDINGTRNEYRITHMTKWFKSQIAMDNDELEIGCISGDSKYYIKIIRCLDISNDSPKEGPARIVLKGWRRVH